ncbi:desmoglein-1-like [Carettochelys insculpta]|uniref:desmoglein-1-like n=1 Tax=Carettochelys insculpta TaxID=44489 RepID=UPI003EBED0AC
MHNLCIPLMVLLYLQVILDFSAGFHVEVKEWNEGGVAQWQTLRRQKRTWIKYAAACREGEDNSRRNPIAKIRSDCEENMPIIYSFSGVGVDAGIFVINSKTGEINITSIVDRETYPEFLLTCYAKHAHTGRDVETPLELRVKVLDINDNPPVFSVATFTGSIEESSMDSTLVMKITATDADEPGHLNSKIAFRIERQEPAGPSMFILKKDSGELHIANFLDREQCGSYSLVVRASDRDGAADGISSVCSCTVNVIDVNDNFPTLSQSSYSVSIEENALSSELLRIQAFDLDEENSDNWLADFFFLSGNDDNYFEFVTDPITNMGILKVIKPLNYEMLQSHQLSFGVRNKAPFHHSILQDFKATGTPLIVHVKNLIEPPCFHPSSKIFYLPATLSMRTVSGYIVGRYAAIDEETGKIASNVRYVMGRDPGAYCFVHPTTGEIRLNKFINLASYNGLYKAEILAITKDVPEKTATGTIVLTLHDGSDITGRNNCPTLTTEIRKVCMSSPSAIVTIKDQYREPFVGPFTFIIVDQPTPNLWTVKTIDDHSVELVASKMEFFLYDIWIDVIDSHGRRCEQPEFISLQACVCDIQQICTTGATQKPPAGSTAAESVVTTTVSQVSTSTSSVNVHTANGQTAKSGLTTLSGAAIALMFLGGLIFLSVPILMAASDCCGYGARTVGGVGAGFEPVPECPGAIHSWGIEGAHPEDSVVNHTTGQKVGATTGDFVDSSVLFGEPIGQTLTPVKINMDIYTNTCERRVTTGLEETTGVGTAVAYGPSNTFGAGSSYGKIGIKGSSGGTLKEHREGGVNMAFLDSYFSEKAFAYADEDEGRPANDCLLIYDHEGIGTPVGSVGCCSFIGEDIDDTYLDTLGPKFKTLAEICLGKIASPIPDVNATFPNIESDLKLPPPGTTIIINESSSMPPPVTTIVTGNTYASGSTLQPARPVPDPLLHGNVMMTETYTSGASFQTPALNVDPLCASNVVVTERVLAPASASDLRGVLDIPDLTDGANVVVTERVIAPGSRLPPSLSIPDLADASNVVVTERVIRPASGLTGGLNIPPELSNAHNVVVTERVVSGPGVGGIGGMSSMAGQMLSADTHLSQTFGSASPGTSRRRVTKYSTVQYANQ